MKLLIGLNQNNIVDLVHVNFIDICLSWFLTDGLINAIIFEVGYLCVSNGMLDACVWGDCWHLQVGEIHQCLGNDVWLSSIAVGCTKVTLQFLHITGKLFQGSRSKIRYLAL